MLGEDLSKATLSALEIPRHFARERALEFSWEKASNLFTDNLVSAHTK
jgi:hypothetical protein